MTKPSDDPGMSVELRKQLLITQGAMYRSGIKSSKEKMVAGMRGDTLARSALKQVGLVALSAWRNRAGLAASLPAVVPMVIGGVSKLWRQPKVKPIVRGIAVAGAVASVVTLLTKWAIKRSHKADDDDTTGEPDLSAFSDAREEDSNNIAQ